MPVELDMNKINPNRKDPSGIRVQKENKTFMNLFTKN